MDYLHLENIRCFRGSTTAPLAPLTLLVGENSAGKSTFLAVARLARDLGLDLLDPNFNEDPFQMGSYDQIAHFHGGQGKRSRSFTYGFFVDLSDGGSLRAKPRSPSSKFVHVSATFTPFRGQPRISSWVLDAGTVGAAVTIPSTGNAVMEVTIRGTTYKFSKNAPFMFFSRGPLLRPLQELGHLSFYLGPHQTRPLLEGPGGKAPDLEDVRLLEKVAREVTERSYEYGRAYATAPIRTRPKRTYDPVKEAPGPEGDHVPVLLSRVLQADADPKFRAAAELALRTFGVGAGLFESLQVRRLGAKKESDPFQLQVRIPGQASEMNLVDVGYGVSQVLPIIVDSIVGDSRFLLLQQPEVHLHPRAQAQLGTFLAQLTGAGSRKTLVETHSDYLIDRVALEVRDGTITPDAVRILFFDRSGGNVDIHALEFDKAGNILNAPPSYRAFFLQEQAKFLGAT